MLVWELVIPKVGLFESVIVVLRSLLVLFVACHWQAPPPQEPPAEDQEEAMGQGSQAAAPQLHFFHFKLLFYTWL